MAAFVKRLEIFLKWEQSGFIYGRAPTLMRFAITGGPPGKDWCHS